MVSRPLPYYVHEETMIEAGFNGFGSSLLLYPDQAKGFSCTVYLSYIPNRNLNAAIIEARKESGNRRRHEWYFGGFEGPPSNVREGKAIDEFYDSVVGLIARKNRIAGKDLQSTIVHHLIVE